MEPSHEIATRRSLAGRGLLGATVGLLLLAWLLNTPPGLLGKADAIGYAVCHRIDIRSFHLGTRTLPLCARCSGMYLGAMLALLFQARRGRRGGMPPGRVWLLLLGLAAAFAVDGLNSYLSLFPGFPSLYQPNNTLRLFTGSGMGAAVGIMLYPAFNSSAWRDFDPRPALEGGRDLLLLLLLTLGLDLLVLSESPVILYPLALVSAAGVLILLTTVYSLVWLMLWRRENRATRWGELRWALVAGFGLALLQIAGLDLVRFLLTGSWDGFHLG